MPTYTPAQYACRDDCVLRMTACYRILLPRCAAAALANHKPLTHALNRLTDDGSLIRHERLLPGGLTVYTLSPSTAARLGLPRERAELPTAAALDTAIAVQVFCHLGRGARFRLTADEVDELFPKAAPNNVPFVISGELGSVAIFRAVLVADRAPADAIRYLRTLIEQAERHKTLASELANRHLGFALLASSPQHVAALEKSLARSGLLSRAAVIIDVGPDAEHLALSLKAKQGVGG
ncbi:MAG: hypothetical protein SH868_01020 [Bythopirellula sp.]|nr:hypothetical protein [Bythopirellula sp.]